MQLQIQKTTWKMKYKIIPQEKYIWIGPYGCYPPLMYKHRRYIVNCKERPVKFGDVNVVNNNKQSCGFWNSSGCTHTV